jgi:cytochrome c oxidase subunit 2
VANVFGIHLSGLPAWAVWALIHVLYLVEFQSRVLVFIQWAIQDLTFNRGARLITGKAPTDFSFEEAVAASARNRPPGGADRVNAAGATVQAETKPPDLSPSPGRLTVFGLLAIGAFPFIGFCLWLLLSVGRHVPAVGGGNVPSILSPASGHAKSLFDLSIFVFAVTGVIFAVVFGLLANALVRYRRTANTALREPPQVYGSSRIEIAWTVVPVPHRARPVPGDGPRDPRRPGRAEAGGSPRRHRRRPPVLVGVPLPVARDRDRQRAARPVSDPAHPRPDLPEAPLGRHRPQLLDPELGGKTDLDPEPREPDVDRPAAHRTLPRPVRAVLRDAAREDAAPRRRGQPEDFDAWGAAQQQPAVRDEQVAAGRRVFETTACINCHAIRGTAGCNGRFGSRTSRT